MSRKTPTTYKSKSVQPLSALQLYFKEISKYPLLSPEEEYELAVKQYDKQDVAAAHRLVTANLRLVVKIANDLNKARNNLLDLIQEGNSGLMQAIKKFNPYKGVKLSTYAAWWIKAYILKFIMDNHSQIRLATTAPQRKLFFNLRKETEKLLLEYDQVTPKLLAEKLDVPEKDVREMQRRLSSHVVSIDDQVFQDGSSGSGLTHAELITDSDVMTDDELATDEVESIFSDHLDEFAETLNERDLRVFNARMRSDEPKTLQELADEFSVSRERARQLEVKIMKNLKKFVGEKGIIDITPEN